MTARLKKLTVRVAGAAVLAPLSVVLQILPPLFLTPWFMRVDFVAVPWVLCWMFFGFEAGLLSLLISVPLVGILGPFAGGFVGAVMKSVASVWMFTVPALFVWKMNGTKFFFTNKKSYVIASILAVIVRVIVTVAFNFYFALPIFFNMTSDQILQFFTNPIFQSFVGHSLGLIGFGAFVAEIAFWNTVQGIIDMYAALIIGFIVLRRIPATTQETLN